MADAPSNDELIELAAVVRAHGLRGELVLKPFNPASDLLGELERVFLKPREGAPRAYPVIDARAHGEFVLLTLEGLTTRDEADGVRGNLVCVTRGDLPEAGEDEYYLVDLVGLEVRDTDGHVVGKVDDVIQYPSVCCMVVSVEGDSVEVPDTERYVRQVDVAGGFVVVDHLDELQDLLSGKGKR